MRAVVAAASALNMATILSSLLCLPCRGVPLQDCEVVRPPVEDAADHGGEELLLDDHVLLVVGERDLRPRR